jgi:DNA primase
MFHSQEATMIDFQAVKASVSFADAVTRLGLQLKQSGNQWRGACPRCNSGNDRALVITEGKGFYCFASKQGGDVIALTAHIRDVPVKDAAEWLAGQKPVTALESDVGSGTKKLAPLAYLEVNEAVVAIGFNPEFAAKHGIGYAGKGIMRGTVAIPFRDEHGTLLGYIGITDATLPTDFT